MILIHYVQWSTSANKACLHTRQKNVFFSCYFFFGNKVASLYGIFFLSPFTCTLVNLKWIKNKWRGITVLLRTGGQGHPTPIHTHTHPQYSNIHKKYQKRSFSHVSTRWPRTDWWTNGRMDGRTDGQSLLLSCVSATKKIQSNLLKF